MMEWVEKAIKPLLEEEYRKGYDAGVLAEKLVKDQEIVDHEHETLKLGISIGRNQAFSEIAEQNEVEEISAEEFDVIAAETEEKPPFGFVGTIDDISLVLGD